MHTALLLGIAVAYLLTPECTGAPSQEFPERSALADPHPHIINGRDTDIEEVPYQISIESLRLHICGGAVVNEIYVVTAAHCLVPWITGPQWFKRLRAGSTYEFPFWWGGSIHQIAEANYHPNFSLNTIDYDVGVIRVSNKFVWSERVRPIVVPSAGEDFLDFTHTATVSGWGLKAREAIFPAWRLQSVHIPLVPRKRCADLHEGTEAPVITSRMLCAAGTGKGGPCQGDSGGPMVHRGKLIGLVSWGIRCNDATFPTVFTNFLDEDIRGYIKNYTGI